MAPSDNALKEYVLDQKAPSDYDVRPYYSKAGDFVSFCWSPQPFFTRRVDEFLTAYHSMATKKVIGCKIKGIRYLVVQLAKAVNSRKPTIKGASVIGRGLSEKPADLIEYEEVWENGEVEIEDPGLRADLLAEWRAV